MILFIGEAPSRPSLPEDALAGRCGDRLARLLGITREEFLREYQRVNVIREYPGPHRRHQRLGGDPQEAAAIQSIWQGTKAGDRLVLCGRQVARAFDCGRIEFLSPLEFWDRHVLVIPHPSGRCRLWNDPAFCAKTGEVLRRFVEERK